MSAAAGLTLTGHGAEGAAVHDHAAVEAGAIAGRVMILASVSTQNSLPLILGVERLVGADRLAHRVGGIRVAQFVDIEVDDHDTGRNEAVHEADEEPPTG
jgi:hypothetical protein